MKKNIMKSRKLLYPIFEKTEIKIKYCLIFSLICSSIQLNVSINYFFIFSSKINVFIFLISFFLTGISIVSPGKRLHCLLNKNNTDVAKIIKGSSDFLEGLYLSLSEPPIWKFMKTKGYKLLESGFNAVDK